MTALLNNAVKLQHKLNIFVSRQAYTKLISNRHLQAFLRWFFLSADCSPQKITLL